jgi:hypothetical protein
MSYQEFKEEEGIEIGIRPAAIIQAQPERPNIGDTTVPHRSVDPHHPFPNGDGRRQDVAIDSTAAAPDAEPEQITAAFFLICLFLARIHNSAAATAASVPPPSTRISSPFTTGHAIDLAFADARRRNDDNDIIDDDDHGHEQPEPPLGSGRKKENDDDDNPMGLVVHTIRDRKRWVFLPSSPPPAYNSPKNTFPCYRILLQTPGREPH